MPKPPPVLTPPPIIIPPDPNHPPPLDIIGGRVVGVSCYTSYNFADLYHGGWFADPAIINPPR